MSRPLPFTAMLLAGLLTSAVASAEHITGTYNVEGTNPNGSTYTGTATISGSSGGNCGISWKIANGQVSNAFCMRQDDVLAAAYELGKSIGLVVYRINDDGSLEGTWSIAGQEGVGTEVLTPQ